MTEEHRMSKASENFCRQNKTKITGQVAIKVTADLVKDTHIRNLRMKLERQKQNWFCPD